jgi:phosphatidylglycerol:prolipoprotein diacylglycerol transferase
MSFHGGFLGVLLAMGLYARKTGRSWLEITDFIAPLVPLGLAAGRIGNFINGELWGRAADPSCRGQWFSPGWTICRATRRSSIRPDSRDLPCSFFLWLYSGQTRPRGAVSGVFLIGYGVLRWIAEYFRSPDEGIFGFSYTVSMGQWLSLPMIVAGIIFVVVANRQRN